MLNYYWTTVNTTCRTSCLIRVMECAVTTPTFFTWYQYCANQNNKMHLESSFTIRPVQLYTTCNWGTDKNKQLTISQQKLALTAINILFALWNHQPPKKFQNQPHLLVRPSSENFCQNIRTLSHETVPLMYEIFFCPCPLFVSFIYHFTGSVLFSSLSSHVA